MPKKKSKSKLISKKFTGTVESIKNTKQRLYPLEGTVFIHKGVAHIVESEENLSVISDSSNDVACYSLFEGYSDVNDWYDLVEKGEIEVIWRPKEG